MATDDTSLILSISADVRQLSRALKRMESDTSRSTRAVEKQFDDMGKNVESRVNKLGTSITGAIKNFGSGLAGGLAAGLGVQQFTRFADGATRITNALKVAGVGGKNLAETYERLGKIALANGASFESVANLYAKVTSASKELGITSRQAEEFTRRIAVGLRASGTDASAASAGIMQLNQALASGVLRGDEFNSVAENLPVVAKAIADGMGVTVGRLRELAAEGELTATKVFDAFMRGSEGLDAQAAKTSTTFSQAFENIGTALTIAVGKFNDTTGASQGFADLVNQVVAPAIVSLGEAIATTNEKHSALAADLQKFAQQTGIEQGAINAVNALKELGSAADPLVTGFQNAINGVRIARAELKSDFSAIAEDFSITMQALQEAGQGEVASGLSGAFIGLTQKIADGTIAAQDFDAVIARLRETGDAMAANLANYLESIKTKFAETGSAAQKSFNEAGQALADALGAKALETVDALAARFSSAMPTAVGRFTSALREAVGLMSQMDATSATIVGQLASGGGFQPGDLNKGPAGGFLNFGDLSFERDLTKAGDSMAAAFIKKFEGFRTNAYYDVNAFRAGFGSDTTTDEAGRVSRVTKDTTVSLASANRDLARRLVEFQRSIVDSIGAETWSSFTDEQQAALSSITYNYGELPDRIVAAIRNGSPETVGRAIRDLGDDNGGVNRSRRAQEANLFYSGSGSGDTPAQTLAGMKDNWEGLREVTGEATGAVKDQEQAYDGLGQVANTVLSGIASALADGKLEGKELLQILLQVAQQLLTMPKAGGGGLFGGLLGGGGADPWAGMRGGGLLGGFLIPGILHDGGTVGKDGYGHGRMVPSSVFAGARKFHKGLMPDEFPAILQRGETVIPRGGFQGGSQQPMGIADVRVSVDNNGNLQAYVQKVSQQEARTTTRAGLRQYDRELTNSFGGRMVRAQAEQL